MNIGSFNQTDDGYTGTLRTLTLSVKAKLVPAEKKTDNSPDFRIIAGSLEVGAAWRKTSKEHRIYLSVLVDDPSFPAPIYANLVEGKNGAHDLIWSRRNGD
jgi:uncharacterized protein (DUF736 family)